MIYEFIQEKLMVLLYGMMIIIKKSLMMRLMIGRYCLYMIMKNINGTVK